MAEWPRICLSTLAAKLLSVVTVLSGKRAYGLEVWSRELGRYASHPQDRFVNDPFPDADHPVSTVAT